MFDMSPSQLIAWSKSPAQWAAYKERKDQKPTEAQLKGTHLHQLALGEPQTFVMNPLKERPSLATKEGMNAWLELAELHLVNLEIDRVFSPKLKADIPVVYFGEEAIEMVARAKTLSDYMDLSKSDCEKEVSGTLWGLNMRGRVDRVRKKTVTDLKFLRTYDTDLNRGEGDPMQQHRKLVYAITDAKYPWQLLIYKLLTKATKAELLISYENMQVRHVELPDETLSQAERQCRYYAQMFIDFRSNYLTDGDAINAAKMMHDHVNVATRFTL